MLFRSAWDTLNRANNEHQTTEQQFTYSIAGGVTAPSTMSAAVYNDGTYDTPLVIITLTRATQPDYWCVKLDGVEYDSRIVASTTFVSGTTYKIYFWGAKPRVTSTLEVEAVVLSAGVYKHSTGNPTTTIKTQFIGIWVADPGTAAVQGKMVGIFGKEEVALALSEIATTYDVQGAQSPVRLTDTGQGYRGSVGGKVFSKSQRDDLLALKVLSRTQDLQLVVGDLSFPIRMEDTSVSPRPEPGDQSWDVAFAFFQSGPPWPVDPV